MSNKKRYLLTYDYVDVPVEIDHDVMTDERLHEINNFWGGEKIRLLDSKGSVLHAVLSMLCCEFMELTLTKVAPIDAFNWEKGNGIEGWPSMDGSDGIEILGHYDEFRFDPSEVQISEVPNG